jgi:hypothetical protein
MAILPHTVEVPGGQPLVIYAETDNINYFLNGALEPDTIDGPVNAQVSVSGSTRRQYPGDATTINVGGATREFVKDPSRSSGPALPGKSFMLVERNSDQGGERRQFTYKGRLIDLHAFIRSEASKDMYLYNNTGARYTIDLTIAPGG